MTKKITAIILLLCMVFSLSACSSGNKIKGSGTEEDPWLCGATAEDDVRVSVMENSLYVSGSGRMMDFNKIDARPWNDIIATISDISIFDDLDYIGKNAFKGAGTDCDCVNVFLADGIKAIGESAFEGVNFQLDDENFSFPALVNLPRQIESIGARAFAETDITELYFYDLPEIAEDAFAGVQAKAFVVNGTGWDDSNKLGYGGELSYVTMYVFSYEDDYGTDEISSEGSEFIPEGDTATYDANLYVADEGYEFVRYELIDGDLQIADPTGPELSFVMTGDVSIKIVYEKIGAAN